MEIFLLLCIVIHHAKYIGSFPSVGKMPQSETIEIAFAGRSNVGKSSLINFITGRKKLAQVSGTPGKTQMINQFLIDNKWKLIDLPGYGYAKVSKKHRASLATMIDGYLLGSKNLALVMVLVDSRIAPQQIDLDFMYRLGENEIPFAICFTKCDKKDSKHEARMLKYKEDLEEYWEEMPKYFETSATKKHGNEAILEWFEQDVLPQD